MRISIKFFCFFLPQISILNALNRNKLQRCQFSAKWAKQEQNFEMAPCLRTAVQTKTDGKKELEKHIISTYNNSRSVILYYFHKQRRGLCQAKMNLDTVEAGGSQMLSRG